MLRQVQLRWSGHHSVGSEPGVVARPGRLRLRQPPAPSPISGLLDSVLTPGSGGGGGESAVAAAQGYYHLKLIHAQVTVPAPPFHGAYSGHRRTTTVELSLKRLFYGDVATGARRLEGLKRRYNDTLKKSLNQLQINPVTWEELAQDRPAWRRSVKTGSAIYKANRIADAKAERAVCKSQALRINTANALALLTCTRCQRTFRARIGLSGHNRT
ncbi:unnamed protein product [Schistocephalus solidus]|uniref:C2H2-type domain-containing protein n=1 Tax=Schistocephalus solidus TaxID=70667 RepID=A0A183TJ72_SCHSO|nr:unnamed protein product [Schistocephalus solidus]